MTNVILETVISLRDATREFPISPGRRPVHFATAWRWGTKGVLSTAGVRVKLEVVRLGGRWVTSREALARFSAALTGEMAGDAAPLRSPTIRSRAAEAARKKLEAIGI